VRTETKDQDGAVVEILTAQLVVMRRPDAGHVG
jgi:hypothetical protein